MIGALEVVRPLEHIRAFLSNVSRAQLTAGLLGARNRVSRPMTGHAVFGRGLVEDDGFGGDNFCQFMTFCAPNILMGAPQRERGPLLMIEQRGLPLHAVVALGAGCDVAFRKLLSVDVLMAVLTLSGGGFEVDVDQPGFQIRRFVAVHTRCCPMGAEQGELRLGMIEPGKFFPGLGRVAGLAAGGSPVGPDLLHACVELSFMRIVMATGAIEILPVINDGRFRLELCRLFVAFGAWHGHVTARQHKMGFLVFGQCERGGLVSFEVVAAVASIEVRGRSELAGVTIAVAISATLKLYLEESVLALGDVALGALQARVASFQRVGSRGVLLQREKGRLPALHVVAGGALSAVGTLGELSVVSILVAVHTFLEGKRLLEVPPLMALAAIDGGVFSEQRKLGLGVVEALVDRLQVDLLPSGGVVAGLAALREAAMMRVLVAVGALVERYANILRLSVGPVGVALGALHLRVQTGQRVTGLGVIELAHVDRLPVDEVVARLAIGAKASLMLILVAGDATGGEAKVGPVQVFFFDRRSLLRGDVRRIVAFVAGQSGVFAFEQIAGLLVVESCNVPLHQGKVFTVVLGVATGALLAGPLRNVVGGMQPSSGREAVGDLGVALQALQRCLASKLVTGGTVRGPVEGLMRA